MLKKITLGSPHFSEGGGHEKCAPGPLFFKLFLNPSLIELTIHTSIVLLIVLIVELTYKLTPGTQA